MDDNSHKPSHSPNFINNHIYLLYTLPKTKKTIKTPKENSP